jgi:hypothetical protein
MMQASTLGVWLGCLWSTSRRTTRVRCFITSRAGCGCGPRRCWRRWACGRATWWRSPEDRRRHLVEVTDAGAEQLAKAECALSAVEDEVLRAR